MNVLRDMWFLCPSSGGSGVSDSHRLNLDSWVKPITVSPTLSTAACPFGGFRHGGDRKPPFFHYE